MHWATIFWSLAGIGAVRFAFYFGKAAGRDEAKGHVRMVSLVLELNGDPVGGHVEITGCRIDDKEGER